LENRCSGWHRGGRQLPISTFKVDKNRLKRSHTKECRVGNLIDDEKIPIGVETHTLMPYSASGAPIQPFCANREVRATPATRWATQMGISRWRKYTRTGKAVPAQQRPDQDSLPSADCTNARAKARPNEIFRRVRCGAGGMPRMIEAQVESLMKQARSGIRMMTGAKSGSAPW